MRAAVACKDSVEEKIKGYQQKSMLEDGQDQNQVIKSPLHPTFKGDVKDAEALKRAWNAVENAGKPDDGNTI